MHFFPMPKVPITKNNYKKFFTVCHGFLIYPKIKTHDILENFSIFEKNLSRKFKIFKKLLLQIVVQWIQMLGKNNDS